MAFFAEDVHLLARYSFFICFWFLNSFTVIRTCSSFILCSASVDGRVYVWKINEGPDDEDKPPQIFGKVIVAIQIVGQEEPIHPRVCWHPHKQVINEFVIYVITYVFLLLL